MNIAILGGSFDPPHKGHSAIANRLLKLKLFDQVWLVPCYQHPFNKTLSPANRRFEMTKLLEGNKIKVFDFEIKRKKTSYTIDTLKFLVKTYPKNKFNFIIGTDQVESFSNWKNWKEIINNFKLFIVPRIGFKKAARELENIKNQVIRPKNITLIDKKIFPPVYISSVLTRKKIKEKKPISNLVPKKIEKYIIEHRLYL